MIPSELYKEWFVTTSSITASCLVLRYGLQFLRITINAINMNIFRKSSKSKEDVSNELLCKTIVKSWHDKHPDVYSINKRDLDGTIESFSYALLFKSLKMYPEFVRHLGPVFRVSFMNADPHLLDIDEIISKAAAGIQKRSHKIKTLVNSGSSSGLMSLFYWMLYDDFYECAVKHSFNQVCDGRVSGWQQFLVWGVIKSMVGQSLKYPYNPRTIESWRSLGKEFAINEDSEEQISKYNKMLDVMEHPKKKRGAPRKRENLSQLLSVKNVHEIMGVVGEILTSSYGKLGRGDVLACLKLSLEQENMIKKCKCPEFLEALSNEFPDVELVNLRQLNSSYYSLANGWTEVEGRKVENFKLEKYSNVISKMKDQLMCLNATECE